MLGIFGDNTVCIDSFRMLLSHTFFDMDLCYPYS